MTKKPVYYGIDMGAPHAGFYAWRWDTDSDSNSLRPYDSSGWDECIEQISKDYVEQREVIIGVEAPIWGAKAKVELRTPSGKKIPIGKWVPRFTRKALKGSSNDYKELLWCTSAGAATSVMTQIFFGRMAEIVGNRRGPKIKVFETYISGLAAVKGNVKSLKKPPVPVIAIDGSDKASHAEDALEALALVYDHINKDFRVSMLNECQPIKSKHTFAGQWIRKHDFHWNKDEKTSFFLGVFETVELFEPFKELILLTNRTYLENVDEVADEIDDAA